MVKSDVAAENEGSPTGPVLGIIQPTDHVDVEFFASAQGELRESAELATFDRGDLGAVAEELNHLDGTTPLADILSGEAAAALG